MSRRATAAHVARMRALVSERDIKILLDLDRVRLLQATQIQRLHFHSGSVQTQARKSRRVLRRLSDSGLIKRLDRRIGGVHAGSSGFVYALDAAGQALLSSPGPAGGSRRRRPWEPSPQFQDHVLAVAEVYVRLRESERGSGIKLISFQGEPAAWRQTVDSRGAKILKPDAFVRVSGAVYEQASFIEVDRSTEHAPTLRRKLQAYADAFDAGVEQEQGEAFPNVVWVVLDQDRAGMLRSLIQDMPDWHSQLFSVAVAGNETELIEGGEQ